MLDSEEKEKGGKANQRQHFPRLLLNHLSEFLVVDA
jgi:hypothetical protein